MHAFASLSPHGHFGSHTGRQSTCICQPRCVCGTILSGMHLSTAAMAPRLHRNMTAHQNVVVDPSSSSRNAVIEVKGAPCDPGICLCLWRLRGRITRHTPFEALLMPRPIPLPSHLNPFRTRGRASSTAPVANKVSSALAMMVLSGKQL